MKEKRIKYIEEYLAKNNGIKFKRDNSRYFCFSYLRLSFGFSCTLDFMRLLRIYSVEEIHDCRANSTRFSASCTKESSRRTRISLRFPRANELRVSCVKYIAIVALKRVAVKSVGYFLESLEFPSRLRRLVHNTMCFSLSLSLCLMFHLLFSTER